MRYQKFTPVQELQPFIECYYVWEGEAQLPINVQSPPNNFCAMVFNYRDGYRASQNSSEWQTVPRSFISGQFTSNYHLELEGKIGMTGIVFKPTAVHNFFGLRMSQLVNSRMDLSLLLGEKANALWSAIAVQPGDKERVEVLEHFAITLLPEAKSRLSIIDEAVEIIHRNKGCLAVDVVATQLKVSKRYLEKKFLEKVGVSPKFFSRIKRFSVLSNIIAHEKTIDWQQIVSDYGFHDQSHLVKEFIEFNQMNPSTYHQHHREMTRFLKP